MKYFSDFLYRFKPGVPRENLFLIAGFAWSSAGSMLFIKGIYFVIGQGHHKLIEVLAASIIGILLYNLFFIKISSRHITRIKSKSEERPCMFSFFDIRGYILIAVMISAGIVLKHLDRKYSDYLYTFYIGMGIPLILSSLIFFNIWLKYRKTGIYSSATGIQMKNG